MNPNCRLGRAEELAHLRDCDVTLCVECRKLRRKHRIEDIEFKHMCQCDVLWCSTCRRYTMRHQKQRWMERCKGSGVDMSHRFRKGWEVVTYCAVLALQRERNIWRRGRCITDVTALIQWQASKRGVTYNLDFVKRIDESGNVAADDLPSSMWY